MKKSAVCFSFLFSAFFFSASAQIKLTPLTTTNSAKVLVEGKLLSGIKNLQVKATILDDKKGIIWKGNVNTLTANDEISFNIKDIKADLWTPAHPNLYTLSAEFFSGKKSIGKATERIGFRRFERRKGNLYLNGKPIFLKGIAINPPNRGIPTKLEESRAFALDYVRYMKSINVNIIRIPDAENWYDACDELGMMVFGGNYSGKVAGGEKVSNKVQVGDETDGGFPSDYNRGVTWYKKEKLGPIAHHPSLMVYAMTNETPFAGERAKLWEKFLSYSFSQLKKWDNTRAYIANAGYGYGKAGDICDIHRYWGWYYSSPYTFLHIRNKKELIPFDKPEAQPITFTECVGNYTGPDGRYNLTPGHKNPSAQLSWTGHERQDLQAQLADEHQSFTLRQATETFRQLRNINPDLSGVFPFTILFYNWDGIKSFADMHPKPVTAQVKLSYQPVLLSWECWTSQAYAGSTIYPVMHLINDDEEFSDLKQVKLTWEITDKTTTVVMRDSMKLPDVAYYSTLEKLLKIKLPAGLLTGNYTLTGRIMANGKQVSENVFPLFIADERYVSIPKNTAQNVLLYDPKGQTKTAFRKLNIPFREFNFTAKAPAGSVLVIGENAADEKIRAQASNLKKFMADGGRVIALRQDSLHLPNINPLLDYPLTNRNVDIDNPVYPITSTYPRNGYSVNPERPNHAVFTGIKRENLRTWSDYTGWTETQKGLPHIQPVTDGFQLQDWNGIGKTAVLANYSSGLQAIALAEQFIGKGSILISGFDLASRSGSDPVADRLLTNMLNYASNTSGHDIYPVVNSPIIWGEYETEKGIVTDTYSGFLVNATPRLPVSTGIIKIGITKEGYQLAGGKGSGFNSRPGIQYVANGRRPWGPYSQSFGGQPRLGENSGKNGTGKFWCRVPADTKKVSSVVWNPSNETLEINVEVNKNSSKMSIPPKTKTTVENRIDAENVHITFSGDRRLVVLETAFGK